MQQLLEFCIMDFSLGLNQLSDGKFVVLVWNNSLSKTSFSNFLFVKIPPPMFSQKGLYVNINFRINEVWFYASSEVQFIREDMQC